MSIGIAGFRSGVYPQGRRPRRRPNPLRKGR